VSHSQVAIGTGVQSGRNDNMRGAVFFQALWREKEEGEAYLQSD
jgi:hypothetical protein